MTENAQEPKKKKPKRWKRPFIYTGIGLLIVILGAGGAGLYEYNRLQPQNHFKDLQTITTTTTANPTTKPSSSQPAAANQPGEFNVLLFGSDARPKDNSLSDAMSHTDSIVLVHVNLNTHQYDMLSIPRDTRVYMPGVGYTKLTSVQLLAQSKQGAQQGTRYAVQFISKLVDVPIHYYAETNYWGLEDLVDTIGGITMDLPFPVTLTHAWYPSDEGRHFTAGPHFLDGKLVAEIVHERYSVAGTDYGRQRLQAAALIGIAKAVAKPENITKLPKLSQSVSDYLMATNLSTQDLISIGLGIKGDFHPQQQIHYFQVKGQNEVVYNNALRANDDEVLLNTKQLQQTVQRDFGG